MENKFYSDTCGVLIGLVSVPPTIKDDKFFEEQIKKELSKCYSQERKQYTLKAKSEINQHLYAPIGYKTFGENDLMFFSLFDDFAYPNRVFHPFHGSRECSDKYQNYDYQLVVGLNTMQKESEDTSTNTEKSLINVLKKEAVSIYPFTCVTRFKVNACFLSGNGLDYTELVKKKIYHLQQEQDIYAIILNGLGGDELILINFAHTISKLSDFIYRCRNLQVKDLSLKGSKEWYQNIIKNRIHAADDEDYSWEDAHVFTSSYSLSGYAIDCDEKTPYNEEEHKCNVTFSWDIKPGHIKNFLKEFDELLEGWNMKPEKRALHVSSSVWKFSISIEQLHSLHLNFFQVMNALRNLDLNKQNIRKLHISISIDDTDTVITNNAAKEVKIEKHPNTQIAFPQYSYKSEFLKTLRQNLDKSKISKILKERIMKMYHNYNDCVQDPIFFTCFIELRHFLDFIAQVIEQYSQKTLMYHSDELHDWLDNSIRDFEHAYLNRFHQSSRMRTLSDFNLEWSGGIQQLISSMDFTYKTFMHLCGAKKLNKFMYVSGYERVHVTDHSYKINMQHITYPELFVSSIWKELFNFLMSEGSPKDQKGIPFRAFSSDEFIYNLKNRISQNYKFNKANQVHKVFLAMLDNEYVVTIIADTLSFYYGYSKNYDLFSYWYWRSLMQSSSYHELNGELNQERFILFFGRLLFIKLISKEDIEEIRLEPFDPYLSEYWMLYFEDVYSIVKILYDSLEQKDFSRTIIGFSDKLLFTSYDPVIKCMNEKLGNVNVDNKEEGTKKIIEKIRESDRIKIINAFRENMLPLDLCNNAYCFIGSFLPSFLHYLRELDGYGCNESISRMLTRDDDGKPELSEADASCYSNILSDPLGGTFCIHAGIQKKYFAARSVFYMTLFHFYEKNIARIIKVE